MGTDHLEPETRSRVASAGGKARAATMSAETRRNAAAAVNSPAGLARRLGRHWKTMSDAERAEVLDILRTDGVPI